MAEEAEQQTCSMCQKKSDETSGMITSSANLTYTFPMFNGVSITLPCEFTQCRECIAGMLKVLEPNKKSSSRKARKPSANRQTKGA